jgi:hypothetical protein
VDPEIIAYISLAVMEKLDAEKKIPASDYLESENQ